MATARDTARFVTAHINDGVIEGHKVFSPSVIQSQRQQQVETDGGYFVGILMTMLWGG